MYLRYSISYTLVLTDLGIPSFRDKTMIGMGASSPVDKGANVK